MSLSFSGTFPNSYMESDSEPAISYLSSNNLTILESQLIYCSGSKLFFYCSDNSDQSNLVWKKLGAVDSNQSLSTVATSGSYNDLIDKP